MKTITVRLPEPLVAEIENESRVRKISKSDVVRERLKLTGKPARRSAGLANAIADLIGSIDGLPADLSGNKKRHLRTSAYGKKRAR
jgi:Arc/MetJ-type ribon-helix-helix transcriptional regulator